jgi:hypothetical protein
LDNEWWFKLDCGLIVRDGTSVLKGWLINCSVKEGIENEEEKGNSEIISGIIEKISSIVYAI